MDASQTELDTFKIMSNVDYVDWSKAQEKKVEAEVILEEDDRFSIHSAGPPPSLTRTPPKTTPKTPPHMTPIPPSPPHSRPPTPPRAIPQRQMPKAKKYTASEENDDYEVLAEKEALLQDLLQLEKTSGVKLTRVWNVQDHTLDELQFEYDRIQSELNANQMVDMAKGGIKFGITGLEMMMKSAGFHAVDGWTQNSCKDMSKYNRPLLRLYKRYWRKTSLSPISELALLMFGGLAWTIAENKMGLRPSFVPSAPQTARANAWEPPKTTIPLPTAPTGPTMKPPSMSGLKPPPSPKSVSSASTSSSKLKLNIGRRSTRSVKSSKASVLKL